MTFEGEVRRAASEYLRKAWDAAVDAHEFVREAAKKIGKKPNSRRSQEQEALLEISKMEHLTVH